MSIHVVVDVDVVPGLLDDAVAAFAELATATLTEEGCSRFDVFVVEGQENRIVLVETWADQNAIDLHMKEDYTAAFLVKADTLLPHPPSPRRIVLVAP